MPKPLSLSLSLSLSEKLPRLSDTVGVHSVAKQPTLKAPFPYFGGKSRVAAEVWSYIGDVSNFVEPFFGSGAVLLSRPHAPKIETVNDLDCYLVNLWRSLQADPEAVADWANAPVFEIDLHARHRWLVLSEEATEFREKMRSDPHYYDAKFAGWWCWGLCCWIGSGWCDSPATAAWEQRPYADKGGRGVNVNVATSQGVHASVRHQVPSAQQTTTGGTYIHAPLRDGHRPQLADAYSRGRGVHGNDAAGTCEQRRAWLIEWFGRLQDRLRTVRVCCGDWKRVCDSESVTTRLGLTGIFFDAPYKTQLEDGRENRSSKLYANDRQQDVNKLVDDVIAYCLERGRNPEYRIVAACYEGEGYEVLLGEGWRVVEWRSGGGYGNRSEKGRENAGRERLFVSPYCLRGSRDATTPLFAGLED